MQCVEPWVYVGQMMAALAIDLVRFLGASLRSRTALAA